MKTGDGHRLIERYLDGTGTPEELAALEDLLLRDPAARLELLNEAGFEDHLRQLLQAGAVVAAERTEGAVGGEGATRASRRMAAQSSARRRVSLWIWLPAAAAAVVAVATLLAFGFWSGSGRFGSQTVAGGGASLRSDGWSPSPVVPAPPAAGMEIPVVTGQVAAAFASDPSTGVRRAVDRALAMSNTNAVEHSTVVWFPGMGGPRTTGAQEISQAVPPVPEPAPPPVQGVAALAPPALAPPVRWEQEKRDLVKVPTAVVPNRNRPDGGGVVIAANGRVTVTGAGPAARSRLVQAGDVFVAGDTVAAASHSSGAIRYDDGTTVRLYDSTRITLVPRNDQTRMIRLASGAVDVKIVLLAGGGGTTGVVVRTALSEVSARMGDFRVMVDATDSWAGARSGTVNVVNTKTGQQAELAPTTCTVVTSQGSSLQVLPTSSAAWKAKSTSMTGSASFQ